MINTVYIIYYLKNSFANIAYCAFIIVICFHNLIG